VKLERGGFWLSDVPIWSSIGITAGTVICLDPLAFASAFGPEPEIESSGHVMTLMDSAPHLVGDRHRHDPERLAFEKSRDPRIILRLVARPLQHGMAPTTRMRLRYWSPRFEIGPSLCLPPVESCRGTIPIQAAKSRPDRKTFGSGTVAAMAVAPTMPIPGMLLSRLLASSERC
jgi:hypothetical protein